MRDRRLIAGLLLLAASLLALAGWGRGQPPQRLPDLDAQASPLPTGKAPDIIAASDPGVFAAPTPAPPPSPIRTVGLFLPASPEPSKSGPIAVPSAPAAVSEPAASPGPPRPAAPETPMSRPSPPAASPPAPAAPVPAAPTALPAPASAPPTESPSGPSAGAAVRSAEATAKTVSGGCGVAIEVIGPPKAALGQPVPYQIVIRNSGPTPLAKLRLELPLPPGSRLLSSQPIAQAQAEKLAWDLGSIEVGGERRVQVQFHAVTAGELSLVPSVLVVPVALARTPVVRAPLTVLVRGPETVLPRAQAVFQIQVANNSDAPVSQLRVTATLGAGLVNPVANKKGEVETDPLNLAPGQVLTLPLEAQATQSGRFAVDVVAQGPSGLMAGGRAVVLVTDPPLALHLDGPRAVLPGKDVNMRIDLANPRDVPAENVRLVQTVPQGLEVVAAGAGAVTAPGGHSLTWTLGTLAPKERRAVACTLRPRAPGDWPVYCELTAEGAGRAVASHSVHVEGAPPLTVEVIARDDVLTVGGDSVYEVRVRNGGGTAVTGLRLSALLPEELAALQPQGPTEARVEAAVVSFGALPQLGAQEEVVYRVRVRGKKPGQGRVRIELSADQLARPVVEDSAARVSGPPIAAGSGATATSGMTPVSEGK